MKTDKTIKIIVTILTLLVLLVVVILNKKIIPPPTQIPSFVHHLPFINALLNSISFILLIFSIRAIKQKNINMHKTLNVSAFILSTLFLVSYVVAHFFLPETIYGDINHNGILEETELQNVSSTRIIYLFILISHILLAAITFPLVLMSFYYGLNNQMTLHKKIVKWSYPMWLYVCLTGPIIYVLLKPYYAF